MLVYIYLIVLGFVCVGVVESKVWPMSDWENTPVTMHTRARISETHDWHLTTGPPKVSPFPQQFCFNDAVWFSGSYLHKKANDDYSLRFWSFQSDSVQTHRLTCFSHVPLFLFCEFVAFENTAKQDDRRIERLQQAKRMTLQPTVLAVWD